MTARPSAWLAGLALGLGLVAAVGLFVTLGGWVLPPVAYVCLFGVGLGPWVVFDHGLWLADAWRKATVDVERDRERNKALAAETKAKLAALEAALVQAVTDTDDDEQLDTAELPKLERERAFQVAHWHVYFQRLVPAGEAYGWDIRTLTAPTSPFKVTTAPGWNNGTDALVKAGYMAKDKSGTRLLVSVADWREQRLWLNVPCPPGEPPDILPPPYTTTRSTENTTKTAAGAVIENGKG